MFQRVLKHEELEAHLCSRFLIVISSPHLFKEDEQCASLLIVMESLHHITELLLQKIDSVKVEILPEAVVALS
jgi:hypothetical protein